MGKISVYTFAEDLCISGDKAYADGSSLVGGIGSVIGHADDWRLFRRYYVDTELITTGERTFAAAMANLTQEAPQEKRESSRQMLQSLVEDTHKKFVEHVEAHRKDKLKVPQEEKTDSIYSGDVYAGRRALELGLIDGIGTYQETLKKLFPEARQVDFTKQTFWERLDDFMYGISVRTSVENALVGQVLGRVRSGLWSANKK
eukprot:TRINITY_DN2969_c0_g1_i2.p1 TRINITY_DN2969_c0_g1~~TRINITY_DN2969_c0_g1_i2.p1  ORF type:complete len:202 (+),score=37.79 TRINITY_DN2969_c0_g1_i2:77-682(+)